MGKNCISEIENSYLPGGALHINRLIKSYYEIKAILELNNIAFYGCYICSCNQFYLIDPCGLPYQIVKCPNCGKDIGGQKFTLIEREGILEFI